MATCVEFFGSRRRTGELMRVGKLAGIDVYIDVSWIFIFALVTWVLSSAAGPLHDVEASPGTRVLLGIVTALLFFASVLAHEFAHSLVARARGVAVSRITLYIFGGVSALAGDPDTAAAEGWIAVIGPLTSVVLGLIFYGLGIALGPQTPAGAAASYLGFANVVLAIFNLLPAYPLDGGRVFHSLLWRWMRSSYRATQVAARTGQIIAAATIIWGIAESLFFGIIGGLWLAFVGWIILQAGAAERGRTETLRALSGRKAADVATLPPPPVPASATVATALSTLLRSGQRAAPVMLDDKLIGIVTHSDIAKLDGASPETTPVTQIMTRIADLKSVPADADSADVVRLLAETGYHQIPVMDGDKLVGFVTRQGIVQLVALQR